MNMLCEVIWILKNVIFLLHFLDHMYQYFALQLIYADMADIWCKISIALQNI